MKIHEENNQTLPDIVRERNNYAIQKSYFTYEDYCNTPENERIELIDGQLIYMDAPSTLHQTLLMELSSCIHMYIKKHHGNCKVIPGPFTVNLFADYTTILEPDISVICDKKKLDERGCNGAPDWIIEIVSPGNPRHDYHKKLLLYRTAGVACYWIIDPQSDTMTVYSFPPAGSVDKELCEHFSFTDTLPAPLHLTDLKINLNSLLT